MCISSFSLYFPFSISAVKPQIFVNGEMRTTFEFNSTYAENVNITCLLNGTCDKDEELKLFSYGSLKMSEPQRSVEERNGVYFVQVTSTVEFMENGNISCQTEDNIETVSVIVYTEFCQEEEYQGKNINSDF